MINVLLILITLIAAYFRLSNLSSLPISLFGDEVDVGYHAWSLVTTGKDYMGHFLPTYIQSLSEWRAPLLMYLTAPFVGVLGPTPFAIRLPVALLGVSSVLLIFLVAKALFKDAKISLLSAFFLAITPWHIHYSRASFEVVPLVFLILLGLYLFLKKRIFWALIPFSLTLYLYSTAILFVPIFLILLYLIYRPNFFKFSNILRLLPSILIALPMIVNVLFGHASNRFGGISVFNDQKIIDAIVIQRSDPWVKPSFVEKIFHNKYFAVGSAIGENYLSAFSPQFLFLSGDPNFRQSIGGQGELLWIMLPLLVIGLFLLLMHYKDKSHQLILWWLFLSPLASSLTQGGGTHATRLFLMLPPLIFVCAKGGSWIFSQQKYLGILVVGISVFCFANYWHRYSDHYRYESARHWHNGFAQIFSDLKPHLNSQNKIYINNTYEPSLLRFALFTQLPPSEFQKLFTSDKPDSYSDRYFTGFRFGPNIYFGQVKDIESLSSLLQTGDIYLAAQGKEIPGDWDWQKSPPSGFISLSEVYDVFGKPQFSLISKK